MCLELTYFKGIGAAQDAARMQRVVSFYEKLPRGAAPEIQPKGLLGRYQARYFGKNPSAARELSCTLEMTSTVCELADTYHYSYRSSYRLLSCSRLRQ